MNKNLVIAVIVLVLVGAAIYVAKSKSGDTTLPMGEAPLNSGENPQPGSTVHDLPVEPAAAVARKDLAAKLNVPEKSIVILQITNETWSDGCLGLGGPAESCLQALVPGFRVEMTAKGKTYIYRTDKTGAAVRAETQIASS